MMKKMKEMRKAYNGLEKEQRLRMIYNVSMGLIIGISAKSALQFVSLVSLVVLMDVIWSIGEVVLKRVFNK